MKGVIVFEIKSVAEIAGLPCMKNLGLIMAMNQLAYNNEYGYRDSTSGQKYLIKLVK